MILKARSAGTPSYEIPSGLSLLSAFRSFDPSGTGKIERFKLGNALMDSKNYHPGTSKDDVMSEEKANAFISQLEKCPEIEGEAVKYHYEKFVSMAMRDT